MGGGNAGHKYNASINNIEGMIKSYKTIALYVYEEWIFDLLLATGIIAEGTKREISLSDLPKVLKYRDFSDKKMLEEFSLQRN